MRVAIIGSRKVKNMDEAVLLIRKNLPEGCSEIVSGGAEGIDAAAKRLAEQLSIRYTCFAPDYDKYGKAATMKRNRQIVDYTDVVLAFWDFSSPGTQSGIIDSIKTDKPVRVIPLK